MSRAQVAALGVASTLVTAICAGHVTAAFQTSVDPALVGAWWEAKQNPGICELTFTKK